MVSNNPTARGTISPAYCLMPMPGSGAMQAAPYGETATMPSRSLSTAPRVYGIQNYGVQRYLPLNNRRELTVNEQLEIKKGLSRWWPKLGAGYASAIPQLLASPLKNSLLVGGFGGSLGSLFALVERSALPRFGAIGFLVGSSLCGISNYIRRNRQNENIIDTMQRLPVGATKRDLLADPAYQADLHRASITGEGTAKDLNMAFNILSLMAEAAAKSKD